MLLYITVFARTCKKIGLCFLDFGTGISCFCKVLNYFVKWNIFTSYCFRKFWLFCSVLRCFGRSLDTCGVS